MTGSPERYSNPLTERYASAEMSRIFSPAFKFGTWRRLWLALAEAEQELGLPVSSEAIEQIKQHLDDVDLKRAAELERQLRHDVMAHVHQLGEQAPAARGVIHLGATSAYKDGLVELNLSVNLAVEGNHVPELEPAIGKTNHMPALAVDG